MAKLGDKVKVGGEVYVLIDPTLILSLNPGFLLVCEFCAFNDHPQGVCADVECNAEETEDSIYVKKLKRGRR